MLLVRARIMLRDQDVIPHDVAVHAPLPAPLERELRGDAILNVSQLAQLAFYFVVRGIIQAGQLAYHAIPVALPGFVQCRLGGS